MTPRETSTATVAAIAGAVLILVVAVLVLVVAERPGDRVLAGVSVEGRDVGGAGYADLQATVEDLAEERRSQPVVVEGERDRIESTRGEVGVRVDADATVEAAWSPGRSGPLGGLLDRLRARFGGTVDVALRAEVDDAAAEAWARSVAEELSTPPREADVRLVAGPPPEVDVVEPAVGEVVDGDDLARRLVEELRDGTGPVRLDAPGEVREPTVGAADLEAVLPAAERAISAPVTLTHPADGPDVELSPADLAEVLRVEAVEDAPAGERLTVTSDTDALVAAIGAERVEELEVPVVEASFRIEGTEVRIVGGTAGFRFDAAATARRVAEVATSPGERTAELVGDRPEPERSREDLAGFGIEERVSTFTTEYRCCPPRVTNIQRIAELVDGAIVRPDEEFSINDHVGPRTREKGFVAGGVIVDGEFEEAVGGGVSQFATTFFNAAFFSGIELLDFQPHSYYIERYPMGRESTIHYGAIDVRVRNDSPYAILIAAEASDTAVTVSYYSSAWAEVEATSSGPYNRVEGDVRDGFDIDFGRITTSPDGSERRESWFHRYQPQDEDDADGEAEADEGS